MKFFCISMKKDVAMKVLMVAVIAHLLPVTGTAGGIPAAFADSDQAPSTLTPVCSSLDGPFCPLVNGKTAPVRGTSPSSAEPVSLTMISGQNLGEVLDQAKEALRKLLRDQSEFLRVKSESSKQLNAQGGTGNLDEEETFLLDLSDWTAVKQSSIYNEHGPQYALDLVRNADSLHLNSQTQREPMPWWELDLEDTMPITTVEVWDADPESLWLFLTDKGPFPQVHCVEGKGHCTSFEQAASVSKIAPVLPFSCSDVFLDEYGVEAFTTDEEGDSIEEVMGFETLTGSMGRFSQEGIPVASKEHSEAQAKKLGLAPHTVCTYQLDSPTPARFIRLQAADVQSLSFSEVEIYVTSPDSQKEAPRPSTTTNDVFKTIVVNLPKGVGSVSLTEELKKAFREVQSEINGSPQASTKGKEPIKEDTIATCEDFPAGWTDSGGTSCAEYVRDKLCTPRGGYGPGWWFEGWQTFELWANQGFDATQACCGCGGGLKKKKGQPAKNYDELQEYEDMFEEDDLFFDDEELEKLDKELAHLQDVLKRAFKMLEIDGARLEEHKVSKEKRKRKKEIS